MENKVLRVVLAGGLIGALATDPRNALQRCVENANREGWRVIQVIPDTNGNLVEILFRLLILLLTLLLYTPANGFFVVLERMPSAPLALPSRQMSLH